MKEILKLFTLCFSSMTIVAVLTSGTLSFADTPVETIGVDSVQPIIVYVQLNTDGAEKMADLLEGVGEAKAQAIVDYREQNGPFENIDQLLNVKGIGEATIDRNRDILRL